MDSSVGKFQKHEAKWMFEKGSIWRLGHPSAPLKLGMSWVGHVIAATLTGQVTAEVLKGQVRRTYPLY